MIKRSVSLKKKIYIISTILILEMLAVVGILIYSKTMDKTIQTESHSIIIGNTENVLALATDTQEPAVDIKEDEQILEAIEEQTMEEEQALEDEEQALEVGVQALEDEEQVSVYDTITISAAGDVTLGRDLSFQYNGSFDHEFEAQNNDYGYFFRNVKEIFEKDDITIVNLETTLTTATKAAEKKFRFIADPSYVDIIKEGDIEAVSIANNHTMDYLQQGYDDTLSALDQADIGYFGYEHQYITEVRGIKVGILGYTGWAVSEDQKETIKQAIDGLKEEGASIVIVMFHWGIEREYSSYSVQQDIAHFTIDSGADLVLGSHPHVLQDVEEYKGKKIVYSLGNFCFGGNKNPEDKDSMILVHKFNFKDGELITEESEIIPCSISSVKSRNNYQPTPLEGEEKERVLQKIEDNGK